MDIHRSLIGHGWRKDRGFPLEVHLNSTVPICSKSFHLLYKTNDILEAFCFNVVFSDLAGG